MNIRHCILTIACCTALTISAQGSDDNYRNIYDQAEQHYDIGQLEQAEKELNDNMKNFPFSMRQGALRLLSLCYIGMDRDEDAEDCVRMLLEENPYYSTSMDDPQRFIDMVQDIKSGLVATITTASSQAESLNEVPVPTTLITEQMIRDSGARNLQEVLAIYVPGMYIIDCNDDINIAMRGVYSNGQEKILFMLDGHRMNSYCTNTAAPDFSISLEKLKQIEVLRGPASSLYGGVALTAVVNLITKQGADIDGIKVRGGIGNYGQYHGDIIFGKRYFDLDILVWGTLNAIKGQTFHVDKENTGLGLLGGDVTVGGIGRRPSYDFGATIKYKNLMFLYNTQFSQVQAPMTMTHTFTPYNIDKYKTFYGNRPSHTTLTHHADLSYGQQFGQVYLKGQVAFDNSDLSHYQAISDIALPGFASILPLPDTSKKMLTDTTGGLARYISGQEHTIGAKVQGEWSYLNTGLHKGLLSFGAEYNYFQLDDARYVFVYDFVNTLPETVRISELGKGHENNANVYAQLKHQWGPVILNAGLRFDYKGRYDDTTIREFSPRVALIYVQPKWNVKLSYAKAFIDAPYLYRKTNQFLSVLMNNMGHDDLPLTPESLHSYQLTFGTTQWVKGLDMEVNAFYNRARDLIYMDIIEHYNMGNSNIFGVEVSGKYEHKRFAAHASATWQKIAKYELYFEKLDRAFNMPRFIAKGVLAWQVTKQLRLHTTFNFSTRQVTDYINVFTYQEWYKAYLLSETLHEKEIAQGHLSPEEQMQMESARKTSDELAEKTYLQKNVPPYFVMDLGANYNIGRLELSLNVHNVLNRKYSLSGACTGLIPQKGRWFRFDVAYKF